MQTEGEQTKKMQNKMRCHLMCELNSQRKDCPTAGLLNPEGRKARRAGLESRSQENDHCGKIQEVDKCPETHSNGQEATKERKRD